MLYHRDDSDKKSYKMAVLPRFPSVTHITKCKLNVIVVTEKFALTYAASGPQAVLIISSHTGVAHMAME